MTCTPCWFWNGRKAFWLPVCKPPVQQHFIFLFRRLNVDKRATGNHCRRFCGPKQDIRVVHLVDFIHYQNSVSKFVEHQPICEGIHRFGAPPQTGIERPQFRRREVPAGGPALLSFRSVSAWIFRKFLLSFLCIPLILEWKIQAIAWQNQRYNTQCNR